MKVRVHHIDYPEDATAVVPKFIEKEGKLTVAYEITCVCSCCGTVIELTYEGKEPKPPPVSVPCPGCLRVEEPEPDEPEQMDLQLLN